MANANNANSCPLTITIDGWYTLHIRKRLHIRAVAERIRSVAMGLCLTLSAVYAQGSVSMRNVSAPFTALETGNTVQVTITGAAPFGTVTVVQNGAPPYTFGTTDAFGNWSTTGVETADNVGAYNQQWFVDGSGMTPVNPDPTYFGFAPELPSFSVYSQVFWIEQSGGAYSR